LNRLIQNRNIRLSSIIALTTTFCLLIETNVYLKIFIMFVSYMYTKIYSFIVNFFSLNNDRVVILRMLKIHLFTISVMYNYILIKLAKDIGFSLIKTSMFILALPLVLQALSTKLDSIMSKKSITTISDASSFMLLLSVYVNHIYDFRLENAALILILSLLTLFTFLKRFPLQVTLPPIMAYIFVNSGNISFLAFMYVLHLSYLYGYMNSLSNPNNILPQHTLSSLFLMLLSLIISLLLFTITGLRTLLVINGLITVLLITFLLLCS